MKRKYAYIRNDDVRNVIEPELERLFELINGLNIPISLACEPENLTEEVVKFLQYHIKQNDKCFEIIQHGLNHNVNQTYPDGYEFGGKRNLESQYEDLKKGMDLLDNHFGNQWAKIISFPYGAYNKATMKAAALLKYDAISSSIGFGFKNRIKDSIGRSLKIQKLMGKKISYHGGKRLPFNFYDVSVNVNIIKKYLEYDTALHFEFDEVIEKVRFVSGYTDFIGILLHHRYHKSEDIKMLKQVLKKMLNEGYEFITLKKAVELMKS